MTEVFIHGLESSGKGTKGTFFRTYRPHMLIDDYEGTLEERMEKLERNLAPYQDLILVGSSYGGLMASIYACQHPEAVKKLVLLAPALHVPEFAPCRGNRYPYPRQFIMGAKTRLCLWKKCGRLPWNYFSPLSITLSMMSTP